MPTTTMCMLHSHGFVYDGRQCFDKQRRGVQGFSTGECDTCRFSLLTGANLDIVENLQVVSQKLDRSDQYMGMSSSMQFWHHIGKIWLEPLLGRVACTLVAEHPAFGGQAH